MLLCFDNAEGGLVLADSKYSKPTVISMDSGEVLEEGNDGEALEIQFEVAGEDKVFYEATEVIVGDLDMDDDIYQVMVYSCNVRNPRYVRYFWKNYGEVRLFGKNGVPVMPFRSSSDDGAVANWSRQGEILN